VLVSIISFRLILKLMSLIIRIVPRGHILLEYDSSLGLVDINSVPLINVVSNYLIGETLEGADGNQHASNYKKGQLLYLFFEGLHFL
jgi:hypothetical protein